MSTLDAGKAAATLLWVLYRTVIGTVRGKRPKGEVLRQMEQVGNKSLLFVTVTIGFLGMVLVFQVCLQIEKITGDMSQVGPEFIKGMVHAFVPSLTAMMLATRVGAGIAAEIGSMMVTEQIDALRMCGVDPIDYLVVPRFIASLVMTLVLSVYATAISILAGALMAYTSYHVNPVMFFVFDKVTPGDAVIGVTKCLAFGAAIPVVSGYCGLTTRGGSEGVGSATTRAVINSSLAVIILDFIISAAGYYLLQSRGL
ncbi:MAG: ABC transporter permease [Deltaproteobacteria bacterium]|nr:ABC transporter permease [Deltaproteobacteria bacterium]